MTYTVKRGDTLSKIAVNFGTTVEALVASNGIKDKNKISVGQVLQIPAGNGDIKAAVRNCLEAIENLPEYKTLVAILEE